MDDSEERGGRSSAIAEGEGCSVGGRRVSILMGLAAAISFASMGSIAKVAYERGASVSGLLALRFSVGGVFWLLLLRSRVRTVRWRHQSTAWVVVAGAIGAGLSSLAEFGSYRLLPVAIVTVLLFTNPLWLAAFARLVHGRHVGKRGWAAVFLLLAGLFLLATRQGEFEGSLLGIGLALLASLTAAVLFVGIEKGVRCHGPDLTSALVAWSASAVTGAVAVASGGMVSAMADPQLLGLVILLGLLGGVIGMRFLTASVQGIGALNAALVTATEPVIAAAIAWVVIGEKLGPAQILGGLLIILGTLVVGDQRMSEGGELQRNGQTGDHG